METFYNQYRKAILIVDAHNVKDVAQHLKVQGAGLFSREEEYCF